MPLLIVEFPDRVNEIFDELSQRTGKSKIQLIRQAIALYKYLSDERAQCRHVCIVGPDNKIKAEIVSS